MIPPTMPGLTDIRRLQTWRVRGRTWLGSHTERPTKRQVTVATEPQAKLGEAERLGHAALAAQEPAIPARVEVDGVEAAEFVVIWDRSREF